MNSLKKTNEVCLINIDINVNYSQDFRIKYIKSMFEY